MLTLRDAQTSKTHLIPPSGAVIGREGGDADILVGDKSVSKKHAKLYARNGSWFIEDLNSSNGTFIDDQRISGPTQVSKGLAFYLSNYQFEVVKIGANTEASGNELEGEDLGVRTRAAVPNPYAEERPQRLGGRNEPIPPTAPRTSRPERPSRGSNGASLGGRSPAQPVMIEEPGLPAEKRNAGNGFSDIPRAIAYFLAAAPKMAVNPVGTVRRGIEEQEFPAMEKIPLAAWLIPGLAFASFPPAVATFLLLLIRAPHTLALGSLIMPPIVAVVGGIVGGFIAHPVMGFIINKILGGQSEEVGRTNNIIMSLTAGILGAIPSTLAVLLAILPVPFIGIVPIPIACLTGLLTGYIGWKWLQFYNCASWAQLVLGRILMIVLGVLPLLGIPAQLHTHASPTMPNMAGMTPVVPGKTPVVGKPTPMGTMTSMVAGTPMRPTPTPVVENNTPRPTPTRVAMSGNPTPGTMDHNNPPATPEPMNAGGSTEYMRWASKRDAVEKAIAENPTLLTHDPQLLGMYRNLHAAEAAIQKKYVKKPGAPVDVVTQRLIEAETFEKTGKMVDDLYDHLRR